MTPMLLHKYSKAAFDAGSTKTDCGQSDPQLAWYGLFVYSYAHGVLLSLCNHPSQQVKNYSLIYPT